MNWPDELGGSSRAAGWLNKLLRACKSHAIVESADVAVSEGTHGSRLRIRMNPGSGGGSGGTVQRYKVFSDEDDYLVCKEEAEDGSLSTETTNVAKPRYLRRSTFNGITIGNWNYTGTKTQRTATYVGPAVNGGIQPGDSLIETLDQAYASASEIFAIEATGSTGVTVSGSRLTWIDLNADARRWVAQRDRVEACKLINGVQVVRHIVIEGGPSFA